MASGKTISIGFKIEDGEGGFQRLSINAKELRSVMQANVAEAKRLESKFIDFAAIATTFKNISDAANDLKDTLAECQAAQRDNILTSQLTGTTGEDMRELRNSIKAVAEYYQKDYSDVLRGVNALSKAYGISAEEALSKVKDGLVSGADAQGDFIDTLKEYPRYFKEAGISAEEFVAISVNAANQGVYSDKGVDVIKEGNLRIREMTKATADALDAIGISATDVQTKLQQGSLTTFQVMQMVAAKLADLPASSSAVGTAIADIFGGPGEDAGLEYIKSLSTVKLKLEEVKAATGGVAEAQEAQIESTKNSISRFSGIADVVNEIIVSHGTYISLFSDLALGTNCVVNLYTAYKSLNIQQGIYKIRTAASTAATWLFSSSANVTSKSVTVLGRSLTFGATTVRVFTVALKGLLISTGVGAAIWAVSEAVNYFANKADDASDSAEDLAKAEDGLSSKQAEVANNLKNATAEYSRYMVIADTFKGTAAEEAKVVDELNNKYGEYLGTHKTINEWKNVLSKNMDKYIQKLTLEAEAQNLINRMVSNNLELRKQEAMQPSTLEQNNPQLLSQFNARKNSSMAIIRKQIEADKASLGKLQGEAQNLKFDVNPTRVNGKGGGKSVGGAATPPPPKDTLKYWEEEISKLNAKINITQDPKEAAKIQTVIDGYQRKIDNYKLALKLELKKGEIVNWKNDLNLKATLKVEVDPSQLKGELKNAQGYVSTFGQHLDAEAEKSKRMQEIFGLASSGIGSVGDSLKSLGEITDNTGFNVAGIVAGSIANIISSYAQMMANPMTSALGPWGWAAFGAAGLAQTLSTVAQIKNVAKFANGGIVSGPTMALVGEYAGARNNPEVIAPLNKLKDLIGPQNGAVMHVTVEGRLRGKDIDLVTKNVKRINALSR